MIKFSFVIILALFLCVVGVSAQPSFEILEDHVNLTDTLTSGFFTVNNTGTEDLAIDFTVGTLTNGGDPLSVSDLNNIANLPVGSDPYTVTFSVEIPDDQEPGLYTGTLTAESDPFDTDTIEINVEVASTYDVSTSPNEIDLGRVSLNSTHTSEFNITNTGNEDLTDVSFGFSKSEFDLESNKTNFVLEVGATEVIQFNITIPADYSTGNLTLGSVNLVSELNKALFDVKAEVGGGLGIKDLDVYLTTREPETGNDLGVDDGAKLDFGDEKVGPESELNFNFIIENTFTDAEDIEIRDIIVRVTIVEIDDGEDIEEESKEFDLEADSSDSIDVILNIPLSVDEGSYDVLIDVEGQDNNGNDHTAQMSLELDIDKEKRDVIVSEASLFPEKIKCSGSSTLTAKIKNIGKNAELNAKLEITNDDLGIDFVQKDIELQEESFDGDDEFTKNLVINVDRDLGAGTYPIKVNSYLQEGILWETKTVNLVVEACNGAEEEEVPEEVPEEEPEEETTEEIETVEVVEEPEEEIIEGEEIEVLEPVTTTEVPLTKRPIFWFLMVVINIIVIAVIAFLVVNLIEKK